MAFGHYNENAIRWSIQDALPGLPTWDAYYIAQETTSGGLGVVGAFSELARILQLRRCYEPTTVEVDLTRLPKADHLA